MNVNYADFQKKNLVVQQFQGNYLNLSLLACIHKQRPTKVWILIGRLFFFLIWQRFNNGLTRSFIFFIAHFPKQDEDVKKHYTLCAYKYR